MSESTPSSDQPPLPKKVTVQIRWMRVSVYLGSIAVIGMIWICALLFEVREFPDRFVGHLLNQLPFYSSTGKVFWQDRRTLEIDDVKLGDFFYADSIVVTASPFRLLRRHVAKVQIKGGQLFTKAFYAMLDKVKGPSAGLNWTIDRLEISNGTVLMDHLGLDTAIPIHLGAAQPIILNHLKLGKPDASTVMTEEHVAEVQNVKVESPLDPLAPVFNFPLIRIRFTYTELWNHRLREIDLIRPTMFVGEDLFWLSTQIKNEHLAVAQTALAAPWEVGHFEIQYGQMAINAFGSPVVQFPFFFDTKVNDVRLDQLDKISAKSTVAIERLSKDYPEYKIGIVNLSGNLYFSLPLTDSKANNVVNAINIDSISWNDIPVTGASSTVTFDPNGVYGKMSGKCEGGDVTGNFEFYYTKGFTWNAELFANKIDCQPIAEKLVGKYLDLSGKINGKIDVQGKSTEILSCQGQLSLPNPGHLDFKSIDTLLNLVKDSGPLSIKNQMANIAVTAFKTYPYENGILKIDYKPEDATGTLMLNSLKGSRKFDIYWHPYESSKVANQASNR